MRTSTATSVWKGSLADGEGTFRAESGAFEAEYAFATRFRDAAGTNPEELLAAAHASCFNMALAHQLAESGHPPDLLETRAACTLEPSDAGFSVTGMRLTVRGRVHAVDQEAFRKAAEQAKDGCPISRVLEGNVPVELDASLEG